MKVRKAYSLAALLGTALVLTACGGPDLSGVRGGSQAVHPSPSALAQGQTAARPAAPVAKQGDLSMALFDQFCRGKTAAQSNAAIAASGQFDAPTVSEFKNIGARYDIYRYKNHPRAGVTVVTGSAGGLQCSVGVNGSGPSLYEDGRIVQSG